MMDEIQAFSLLLAGIDPREAEASKPDWQPYPYSALDEHDRGCEVLVVGDVHGRWEILNRLIAALKPAMVLQVGDFGFFPRLSHTPKGGKRIFPFRPHGKIKNAIPIYFCDGNHEDHQTLAKLRSGQPRGHKIAPGVFYQERGSTITLPDGRTVLFFGGATSHDAHRRKQGHDWFPEEVPTADDLAKLSDKLVDIVIAHQSPALAGQACQPGDDYSTFLDRTRDPARDVLDEVFLRMQPHHWYYGHWHGSHRSTRGRTKFRGLDQLTGYGGSWTWLPAALPSLAGSERASVLWAFAAACAAEETVSRAYVTGSFARGDCTRESDLNAVVATADGGRLFDGDDAAKRICAAVGRATGFEVDFAPYLAANDDHRLQPLEDNLLVYERTPEVTGQHYRYVSGGGLCDF